jgi:CHAT domain-containing protein
MRAIQRVAPNDPKHREQAFKLFQRNFDTRTASALSQMAARTAAAGSELAQLVRQQQDLTQRRARADKDLIAALGARQANNTRPVELRAELQRFDDELGRIGRDLSQRFPQYSSLVSPEPSSLTEVQRILKPDEALVGFLEIPGNSSLPAETHGWVVTREAVEWRRLDAGDQPTGWVVTALRCGLDDDAWDRSPESSALCQRLTGVSRETGRPLPFSLNRAYGLYQRLLAPFEPMLKTSDGKWRHLLVVLSGPLAVLPIETLVTAQPAEDLPARFDGYRDVQWLGIRQPITMLPSVASLVTLRAHAKESAATEPFIGFGNPLLVGENGIDKRAWSKQSCTNLAPAESTRVGAEQVAQAFGAAVRGGVADVNSLRRVAPLPETADELCAVAAAVGAGEDAVNLGARATEARIKALSADGALAKARIVHFATHGLLASEAKLFAGGKAEPSLLLTPPATATESDDGLLTASEIADLKLDADWVILSACNTAAGETGGIDAFSGLARAFFYAGARSLLVSHWYVDSAATVELVTSIFSEIRSDPQIGRSEALRRSIVRLISHAGRRAHPATWAPFVVVGEGAAH